MLEQFYNALRLVAVVATVSLLGVFVISGDLITILISVELFLLAIMVSVIIVAGSLGDPVVGELFILTVLVVGAAETAVALSIVTLFYQGTAVTGVDLITLMEEVDAEQKVSPGKSGSDDGSRKNQEEDGQN